MSKALQGIKKVSDEVYHKILKKKGGCRIIHHPSKVTKSFKGKIPNTSYQITQKGSKALTQYWKNLDKKMQYMSDNGFVPYLETIRRDHFPTWIKYYNFQESFPRFLTYIRARYGAYNFIYALAHMDAVPSMWLKDGKWDAIKSAFNVYYDTHGPMPFGQPTTLMADWSTYNYVGDPEWIMLHSTGNRNRHNKITPIMEELFKLNKPCFNNEPYYTGHNNPRKIAGEAPPINSDRDNYFARANMYCNVLSGGMAGYVYGSLSWPGITTGEPDP